MTDKALANNKTPKLKARIQRSISPKTQTISLECLTASLVEDSSKNGKITEKHPVSQPKPSPSQDHLSPKTSASSKAKPLKQIGVTSPTSKPSDEYKLSVKSPKVPKLNMEGLLAQKTPPQNRIISPSPHISKQSTPRKIPINARKISSSGQPTPRDRTDYQENSKLQHSHSEMKTILMTSPLRQKIQSQIISKQHPTKSPSLISSRAKGSTDNLKSIRMNLNENLITSVGEITSKAAICPKCGSALPGSGAKSGAQTDRQVNDVDKKEYEKIKAMYRNLEQEMARIQEKTKTIIQEASQLLAQKNKEIVHLLNQTKNGAAGTTHRNSHDVTYESILRDSRLKEQEFNEFAHILKEELANYMSGNIKNSEDHSTKPLIGEIDCSSSNEPPKNKSAAKAQEKDKKAHDELQGQIEKLQNELKEQKEMYEQVSKDIADMFKKEKAKNDKLEDEVKALKREIASLSSFANSEVMSDDSDETDIITVDYEDKLHSFQEGAAISLQNIAKLLDRIVAVRMELQRSKKTV